MAGGRPTSEPRNHLVAVRLHERHVRLLRERARRENVTLSEALRRFLDSCAETRPSSSRRPTAEERQSFDQVFAALGLTRQRPRRKRKG